MADLRNEPPRYGVLNLDYIETWGQISDDEPMWALNLMHYRARAGIGSASCATPTGTP